MVRFSSDSPLSTANRRPLDVSINVLTIIFRSYLLEQSMDHLSATLKKGGIRDLLAFFPGNKQEAKTLEDHFRKADLPQIAEWYAKKQYAMIKDAIIKEVQALEEREESPEQVRAYKMFDMIVTHFLFRSFPLSKLIKKPTPSQIPNSSHAFGKV